ncbi:MAG: hypothetical protein ACI9ES_000737 [Oceanospirillaceae bacterium]|jgi:hypothetical protein
MVKISTLEYTVILGVLKDVFSDHLAVQPQQLEIYGTC